MQLICPGKALSIGKTGSCPEENGHCLVICSVWTLEDGKLQPPKECEAVAAAEDVAALFSSGNSFPSSFRPVCARLKTSESLIPKPGLWTSNDDKAMFVFMFTLSKKDFGSVKSVKAYVFFLLFLSLQCDWT